MADASLQAGFRIVWGPQGIDVQLAALPHAEHAPLVSLFRRDGYLAALMGRVYYRQAVLDDIASRESAWWTRDCETNDAALAWAAYRDGKLSGLERLEGDFALALCDMQAEQLIAMRDPLGGYPLFWFARGETAACSTSLRSLANLLPALRLDAQYLGQFVMLPGPRNEGPEERCVYEDIARVCPDTIVRIHRRSGRVERHRYWDWATRLVDPGTDRVEEAAEHYGHVLGEAVRQRLRGRTISHLSGGMDSTSVSLLARDWTAVGVGEAPLHTLSLVYVRFPGLARERPYLEAALQQERGLVAHRLLADELLNFDGFREPPLLDEPYAGMWRIETDRAMVEVADQVGAATMLSGSGADDVLENMPFVLADLLRRGRFLKAWQEAGRWARVRGCNRWAILKPFGIQPLTSGWAAQGLRFRWWRRGPLTLREQSDWTVPPWILPEFARRHELQRQAVRNVGGFYRLCPQTGLSLAIRAVMNMTGDVIRWSLAAPRGIHIAHPFLDPRVVSLGLGIKARLQPEPGQTKPILAAAMRGKLPEQILRRRYKGHFSEVYYLGLSRNLPYLERLIQTAPLDDLQMLDKDLLLRCLREATVAGVDAVQLQRLDFTLALIQWLSAESHQLVPHTGGLLP